MNVREAIALAAHVAESRATVPILACVRVANGCIVATDTLQQIEIPIELPPALAKAAFCVQAARLTKVLKALPEDAEIDLQVGDKQLIITSGPTRFELNTLPPEDFPLLGAEDDEPIEITLEAKALTAALNFIAPAMAVQDVRYYLLGAHFALQPGRLMITATDGSRLHRVRLALDPDPQQRPAEGIVARASIARMIEIAERHAEVNIGLGPRQIVITDQETLFSKLIDGAFPNADQIIPSARPVTASVDREELAAAVKRVAQIHAGTKSCGVMLDFEPDHIAIGAKNAESERAATRIEWNITGKDFKALSAGFQHTFLIDAFAAFSGERVFVHLGEKAHDSLYLTDDADGSRQVVIMPTRL